MNAVMQWCLGLFIGFLIASGTVAQLQVETPPDPSWVPWDQRDMITTTPAEGGRWSWRVARQGTSPETTWVEAVWIPFIRADAASEPDDLPHEIIIDNGQVGTSQIGTWDQSEVAGWYGEKAVWSRWAGGSYTWETQLPIAGSWTVEMWWTEKDSRTKDAIVTIVHALGRSEVHIDQTANGSQWNVLGKYDFAVDPAARVVLYASTDGSTVADAIRFVFVPIDPEPPPEPEPLPPPVDPGTDAAVVVEQIALIQQDLVRLVSTLEELRARLAVIEATLRE